MTHAINTIIQGKTALFSAVLRSSTCPTAWCSERITPTYKTGDITNPTNYRGITMYNLLPSALEYDTKF